MKVRDLMTTEVITIDADTTLATAEHLMKESRIRHLPVIDDDFRLIGLLTHRDLLAAELSNLHGMEEANSRFKSTVQVSKVMRDDVECASADDDLAEVARTLQRRKFGCMPVLGEEGVLVGIITATDYLRLVRHLLEVYSADSGFADAVKNSAGHKPRT